ncbi:MAG: hypothetical protein WC484_02150 [Candidatus Omnitrophota bacterium]
MFKKIISLTVIVAMFMAVSGVAYAAEDNSDKSLTRGAASLVLPGWGQYLNHEMDTKSGKIKTGAMVVLEIGGIVTIILLATLVGYPVIWVGIGILMFNHIWSASDAYLKAPVGPEVAVKGDKLER